MGLRRTLNMMHNLKNWDAYLWYKIKGKKEDVFTFQLKNNLLVEVPKQIIREFKESLFEEIYIKYLPKKIVSINNPVVIDIGANVGYFTMFSLIRFKQPKIIAFEPIQRNFKVLQKNLKPVENDKYTIVNKAVSNSNGIITLKFNSEQSITTSATIFNNEGLDEEKVASISLEQIFNDYSLAKIDLLKLDCEGAEYEIFYKTPAELFKRVNCIALETHIGKNPDENTKTLANYIESLSFNVVTKNIDYIWAYKDTDKWI